MESTYTNKLINETSQYLLQHAHNPVNWFPWGEEALQLAQTENKPILVSIGYAACHWCHVMERESFEDPETASLMNKHFINIKIDREERPDLDHIYMDAVQAMTGSGGWPLNVFLTPEKKPFYGGTYFPPQKAFNRPSWRETLLGVAQAFRERKNEIDAQAENLLAHLQNANSFGQQTIAEADQIFLEERPEEIYQNIMKSADKQWGGFGKAPKFPQTFSIQFLLRFYHLTGNQEALAQALLSLNKMIDGGIYDQIGGGFARYSTDAEWLVPHFEKMLYDNALLVSVMSEAYQITYDEKYKLGITQTIDFLKREMLHPSKGFYAALDADSEGVEGKFYTWSKKEVVEILGEDAAVFCKFYDVTEEGNWEHNTILWVKKPMEAFADENNMSIKEWRKKMQTCNDKLLQARALRIRPLLDDKILLGWNALMNTALSKAFCATGDESYRTLAVENMYFLLDHLSINNTKAFHHTWKNGTAKYPAFLDDYAFLIEALIHLQEITADSQWIAKAEELTKHVIEHFKEDETPYFFYTAKGQEDVIVRKKEVYDGAVPSGNSVMADNLHQLSLLLDQKELNEQAVNMVKGLGNAIVRYPTSFANWAALLQEQIAGTKEIVILGELPEEEHIRVLHEYIPHRVLMCSDKPNSSFPLIRGKSLSHSTSIYLCSNYTCHSPVFSAKDLMLLINKG